MRTAGAFTVAALSLGIAVAGPLAAARAEGVQPVESGPLILTPESAPAPAVVAPVVEPVHPPTVATAVPVPPPALPAAADPGQGDSDEPRTTGIDEAEPDAAAPAATAAAPVPALPGGATLEGAFAFDPARAGTIDRAAVERFYAQAGVAPLWTGSGRLAASVPALLALVAGAGEEGLDPARYPLGRLAGLLAEGAQGTYEVLLTDTLIRYVADRNGAGLAAVRLPVDMRELGKPVDAVAVLLAAVTAADPVAAVAATGPQDADYRALRQLLADYRALAAAGGWPSVPTGGAKIEPGAHDGRIPAIRARLAVTDGAGPAAGGANHYDPELVAAVKRFQSRHGLKTDGVIGKLTLDYMAVPVEGRIRQLLVNLERKRQHLADLGPNRIIVNVPEFTLRYYEDGVLAMTVPVVIGRKERKTPLLESKVTNLVLNPPWSVPARNAGEDIVRKQINDPTYLQSHGYTVYYGGQPVDPATIDWTQVPRSRSIPYRLRQAPGAGNSLGRLKINFQNDYAVYLHDTPDKHLFARDMRALSSGCVRVQDPFSLGARLLRDVPGWDRARMDSLVATSTSTTHVSVVHDIGVRLTYVTAWVDAAGTPQFRDDLYGIDARIDKGLARPALLAENM
ncbi:L,D-transpeptidase family protein [Zavarzinia compransoris]|uniref:L,D-TPase catalytic domain-containing protein n=1 Tax=Zavarzinia compransoris TaxID=1264899 RepID=A0A317EAG7_9PROT|nr:L,D-transpeptidase family protein [Zavarzinia compransoris]PWR22175.1 hypothetical protein DKG75_09420 [Zavarzinia compransoris]TDP47072.1 murein L,D-transpeptidase YcbB/YkuD [Zavarzinia compransoris]